MVFEDLMYQNLRPVGAASSDQSQLPTGLQVGLGVRVAATTRNFSQGNLQQTGSNLDVAIKGQGFFQIQLPDGTTGYTRDGAFQVDANGQLVTNAGHVGAARHHRSRPTRTSVTDRRRRHHQRHAAEQAAPQSVGQLQLAVFVNPAGLEPRGGNLYAETAASGTPNAGAPGRRRPGRAAAGLSSRAATSTWWRSWCR